jgi:Ser/Thr protein kinase RdoA (MazF antagonist)
VEPESLGALLDVPPPVVDASLAQRMAAELFDVHGIVSELSGERDRNFLVRDPRGGDWVLKVVHPQEDPAVTELQSVALEHVASRNPALPVPRVRTSCNGGPTARWRDPSDPSASGAELRVRMYSYLPGIPMARSALGPELARNVGTLVAELDLALADLDHPGQTQDLAWDAHRVESVEHLVDGLPTQERDLVEAALDHFRSHTSALVSELRRQVIHNDANLDNVLTVAVNDPTISGVIDFGDLLRAPLVQDVATAAAYQVRETGHPLAGPADVLRAYHQRLPLRPEEIQVVADLITARWVLTTTITGWRARRQPENHDYILRNSAAARSGLRRLGPVGCPQATAFLCDAIKE